MLCYLILGIATVVVLSISGTWLSGKFICLVFFPMIENLAVVEEHLCFNDPESYVAERLVPW